MRFEDTDQRLHALEFDKSTTVEHCLKGVSARQCSSSTREIFVI